LAGFGIAPERVSGRDWRQQHPNDEVPHAPFELARGDELKRWPTTLAGGSR
jgi:hypothetical protein